MMALDTSVLVRYLVQDHPAQAAAANRLIEEQLSASEPGFVSAVVLCEVIWVLESAYGVDRKSLDAIVTELLASRELFVEKARAVRVALEHVRVDLSDAIIHEVGRTAGCGKTVTFDRKFARLDQVELLA